MAAQGSRRPVRMRAPADIAINRAVWLVWSALLVFRATVAANLPLLGDEAFYWQESRALAFGYSDIPPVTAWLIALGTSIAGDSLLGVRWPFLLIGALLPWLLRAWARSRGLSVADSDRIALIMVLMPLGTITGILAVPDVPLAMSMLLAFVLLDRAAERGRWRDWVLLGLALAAAVLTHWRAALLFGAGLVWVVDSRRGARALRSPGLWLALAIVALVAWPLFEFNRAHDWSALRFQLLDRNPWSFQWSGLAIIPEQVLLLTPLLALSIFSAARLAWRSRQQESQDLARAALLGILLVYIVAGVFADNERMRVHWPLPGYFPLLLSVPLVLQHWRGGSGWRFWAARCYWPVLAVGSLALVAVAALASFSSAQQRHVSAALFGGSLIGWPEAAARTRALLADRPEHTVLIADNFLLAAELDFALHGTRRPFVLDHPRNRKHGRQQQLGIWQRDEAALNQASWSQGLLVFELGATERGQQLAAWRSLCARFGSVRWIAEETVLVDEVQFLYAEVTPRRSAGACAVPSLARIDWPAANQRMHSAEPLQIVGWAISEPFGVDTVTALIDGAVVPAVFERFAAEHVHAAWPDSHDPDLPRVGFRLRIEAGQLTAGEHRLEIEVSPRGEAPLARRFGARNFFVVP